MHMSWKEVSTMSLKKEFISFVMRDRESANISLLCKHYGISRTLAYKLINRYLEEGESALVERSRRPHTSPKRTPELIEYLIISVKKSHPAWGGAKIRDFLHNNSHKNIPAPSTITQILRRHNYVDEAECLKHTAHQRFEYEKPNLLWQMDFKGDVKTLDGVCYPLTVLDDHSRFSILIKACNNKTSETTKEALVNAFRTYGMPHKMLVDNGSPWGAYPNCRNTSFSVWLMRLGVSLIHGRPYHPQTQGKEERFHRTMVNELISHTVFRDINDCQRQFDSWREEYNFIRPHESVDRKPPASRFIHSNIEFPEALPKIEYSSSDIIRKVSIDGDISYKSVRYKVGKAFQGYPVAIRYTQTDGVLFVYFCSTKVAEIDLYKQNDII